MKKFRNPKLFVILLVSNIVFFITCLATLIRFGSYFAEILHLEFIVQCVFTLTTVFLYYFIDLAKSARKIAGNIRPRKNNNNHKKTDGNNDSLESRD